MPKICYTAKKFNPEHARIIDQVNGIVAAYAADGYTLTLRQIYYQMIARDLLPATWISAEGTKNNVQNYKRLGDIVSKARRAGLIDWNAVEDRTRNLKTHSSWGSPADVVDVAADVYTVDFWEQQGYRPEVWVEKDALIGIMKVACDPFQVPYFSCRGYTSDSELWAAAQRLARYDAKHGQIPLILHLGDHDPSGKDMSRDIYDRLRLFSDNTAANEIEVRRLALNMDQVTQYDPPPNPAKSTDARYAAYRREFGDESWELDALEPEVIAALIRDEVQGLIDPAAWAEAEQRRDRGRSQLRRVVNAWVEVTEWLGDEPADGDDDGLTDDADAEDDGTSADGGDE